MGYKLFGFIQIIDVTSFRTMTSDLAHDFDFIPSFILF